MRQVLVIAPSIKKSPVGYQSISVSMSAWCNSLPSLSTNKLTPYGQFVIRLMLPIPIKCTDSIVCSTSAIWLIGDIVSEVFVRCSTSRSTVGG